MNKNDLTSLKSALETMAALGEQIASLALNALQAIDDDEPDVSIQSGGTGRPDGPGFGGD